MTASLTEGGALVLTDADGKQVGGADPAAMYGAATDPVTGDPTLQQLVPAALMDGQDGPVLRLTPTRRSSPTRTSAGRSRSTRR